MKRFIPLAIVVAFVMGAASPAYAYLGETGNIGSCGSAHMFTTVVSTVDAHHRVNGVNSDRAVSGTTVTRTNKSWFQFNQGQWSTGSYRGSYSYSGSGGRCES